MTLPTTLAGPEKLVYMANQIARHFAAQPGEAAAEATADHLRRFWTPAMRRAIAHHAGAEPSSLTPVAGAAVALLDQGAGP